PSNQCGPFGKTATGYTSGTNIPAFCYSITVINCGGHPLTNVSVIDDKFGNITSLFFPTPTTVLPVGGSLTGPLRAGWSVDTINTVFVSGKSTVNSQIVTNSDFAVANVRPASITCQALVTSPCDQDGNTNDNHVMLPSNGVPCAVTFTLIV